MPSPFTHNGNRLVFYYPTLMKYGLGGGTLGREYTEGKIYFAGVQNSHVTKTPDKLRTHIANGATDIVIMGHSSDQPGSVVAGGSACLLPEPKKTATEIGEVLSRMLQAPTTVERIWVWTCHSSINGVALAIHNARTNLAIQVFGTPVAIGSPFYFLTQTDRHEMLAPIQRPAVAQQLELEVQSNSFVLIA